MPFLAIFHALIGIGSIVLVSLCLSKWGAPRMHFFTLYATCVSLFAVAYYYIIIAPSLDAAITAHLISCIGSPFIAVFNFLFVREYCDTPVKKRSHTAALLALPVVFAFLLQIPPFMRLYHSHHSFRSYGSFSLLHLTPGPFFYVNAAYTALLVALACVCVYRYVRRTSISARRNILALLVTTILPLVAVVIQFFNVLPLGYNPLPAVLVMCAGYMFWHLSRYRQHEWITLGREAVLQNMKDAFILVDANGLFLDANGMARRYFPSLADAYEGQLLSEIPSLPSALYSKYNEDGSFIHEFEGDTLYLRISRSELTFNGKASATSILIYDDTENRDTIEKLQQIATHDALTGLHNRGTFFSFATRDFDLCLRRREAGSVLMLDIDHFKQVNDLHGHAWGDKVLVSISSILSDRLRHTDISGRYGGEELAVWLPGAALEEATIIADVIRRAIEHTTFSSTDGTFSVTISIGVSGIDYDRKQTFDDLINEADTALYKAKQTGRNRVCSYVHTGSTAHANP